MESFINKDGSIANAYEQMFVGMLDKNIVTQNSTPSAFTRAGLWTEPEETYFTQVIYDIIIKSKS